MKRLFALILAVLMICALFAGCGKSTVKATVDSKYDDGFAKEYADKTTTDDSGSITYEFTGDKYDEYVYDHKNNVANTIKEDVVANHSAEFGQYVYINTDSNSVIIGLNPGEYEESYAKAEAPAYAEKGFVYFQNLEKPVSSIKVVYCNANDQSEVYGSFEFSAE